MGPTAQQREERWEKREKTSSKLAAIFDTRNQDTLWKRQVGHILTIQVDWEMSCKNSYTPSEGCIFSLALAFVNGGKGIVMVVKA